MPVYKCPKCGRMVELPEGAYYCKFCGPDAVLVPVSRSASGYLYVKPYVGDRWFLTSISYGKPPEEMKAFWEWIEKVREEKAVDDLFKDLVGKKVKITVEVLE